MGTTCSTPATVDYSMSNMKTNTDLAQKYIDATVQAENEKRAAAKAIIKAKSDVLLKNILTTGNMFPTGTVNQLLLTATPEILIKAYVIVAYFEFSKLYPHHVAAQEEHVDIPVITSFISEFNKCISDFKTETGEERTKMQQEIFKFKNGKIVNMSMTALSIVLNECSKSMGLSNIGHDEYLTELYAMCIAGTDLPVLCTKYTPDIGYIKTCLALKDDEATIVHIIKMQQCSVCKHAESEHTVCSKYVFDDTTAAELDRKMCKTCGKEQHEHKVCSTFVSSGIMGSDIIGRDIDMCETCSFGKESHYHKACKDGALCCSQFVKDGEDGYCKMCPHKQPAHAFSDAYWNLSGEDREEVQTAFFAITCRTYSTTNPVDKLIAREMEKLVYKPDWRVKAGM
jgi:hypothetical protein